MARLSRSGASLVALVLASILSLLDAPSAAAGTAEGVAYLKSQQIAGNTPATGSGAWDSAAAFEFVTTEAVVAVADQDQSGPWNTATALSTIQGFDNAQGVDPLPFLDLVAAGALTPGKAAKLILLVAAPLGLDPTAFDPAGNGAPVNLAAAVGSPNPDGSFGAPGFFGNTLYAALSKKLTDGSVPASTIAYIRSAQKANGGWSFDADPGNVTDAEVDTTSSAIQVLVAGGASPTDPDVQQGLAFIASQQNADGTWSAFGNVSAEATSRAILAVVAAGYDPSSSCWRDTVLPARAGTPYVSLDTALLGLQAGNGAIAGPGVFSDTFSTAQAVQGLERGWLPIARGAAQTCAASATPGATPAAGAATAVGAQPAFTG